VGKALGGIKAFDDASPTDGRMDLAVVTAQTPLEWSRVLTRIAVGRTAKAKHVKAVAGRKIDIRLKEKRLYEIDGGDRAKVRKLKIRVEPRSLVVCVPADEVA
jgi:diacylglycerol kinase family enzyme